MNDEQSSTASSSIRRRDVSPAAHAVFRALIDELLATGLIAAEPALGWQTGLGHLAVTLALGELSAADWIGRDVSGGVVALYPFSPQPTGITAALDGAEFHAMCAVDALGIAP